MTEKEWVKSIIDDFEKKIQRTHNNIRVVDGHRLAYVNEIFTYNNDNKPNDQKSSGYQTDILILEHLDEMSWKPRVVIETKLARVTTHDAITYSQKAQTHKFVHPYLRYGILIGNWENNPLPGRLFRHGQHFDFMLSWKFFIAEKKEMERFLEIVNDEIIASKMLDKILFNTRSKDKEKFTCLHRPLKLFSE